jgi:uncharacterized protein
MLSAVFAASLDVTAGDVVLFVVVLLVGVGAGVLSALLGVGGAVVTTPAIRALGATPIQAVGSTVPAIFPSAISGSLRYAKEGLVEWRTALTLGAAGAVFAFLGAWASDPIGGEILMVATAVLMLWSGIVVLRGGRRVDGEADAADVSHPSTAPADAVPRHSVAVVLGIGVVSGFIAGLLGVGGGIVMVPMMTGPLRFPMRVATASSLVAVAIMSVPALITHIVLDHVNWAYAVPLMIGVIPGARIGARITVGSSDRAIRRFFGIFIVVTAVVFGITQGAALR